MNRPLLLMVNALFVFGSLMLRLPKYVPVVDMKVVVRLSYRVRYGGRFWPQPSQLVCRSPRVPGSLAIEDVADDGRQRGCGDCTCFKTRLVFVDHHARLCRLSVLAGWTPYCTSEHDWTASTVGS